MVGKKTASIMSAIVVVCVVIVLLGVYEQPTFQAEPLQKDVDAEITDFSVTDWGSFPCIVGVTVSIRFNVTVQNTGRENLTGLNLQLYLLSNDTATPIDLENCWYSTSNFSLASGQTGNIEINFLLDFNTAWAMRDSHQNFLVTLNTVNGPVLAERKLL